MGGMALELCDVDVSNKQLSDCSHRQWAFYS